MGRWPGHGVAVHGGTALLTHNVRMPRHVEAAGASVTTVTARQRPERRCQSCWSSMEIVA